MRTAIGLAQYFALFSCLRSRVLNNVGVRPLYLSLVKLCRVGRRVADTTTRIQTFFFLSRNLAPLFLRLQHLFYVFKFLSFVTFLSTSIALKLAPENVLGVSILPPILSKRDET